MGDADGGLTDEALEDLRDRLGEEVREPQPYVEEATKDTIRHWANGIGTDNPLYTDEAYANDGPYGELIAPPTFLYATNRYASGHVNGLPGVHAMYAGSEWEWHRPVRRGDRIETTTRLSGLEEKDTSFGGRSVKQVYTIEFHTRAGAHLATADSWTFRMDRESASQDERKYESEDVDVAEWDADDIERFAEHYRQEERRGAEPRFVEDVAVGQELDTLLKGPTNVTGGIAFLQGFGGAYIETHRRLFDLFDRHPSLAIPNDQGVPEPPVRVHWDAAFARQSGVPAPFDFGPERVASLGHVCHHWMGDRGSLRRLNVELRRHTLVGDVTWCTGEVTDKRVDAGDHIVEIDLEARDQDDELTATGSADVQLPSRETTD
jgi:acyl dehydratase